MSSSETYTLYILKCRDGTLYTGIAKELKKRLLVHKSKKGAKYVAARLPFKLVYQETHPDKSSALKREFAIKQLTRLEKLKLVKNRRDRS